MIAPIVTPAGHTANRTRPDVICIISKPAGEVLSPGGLDKRARSLRSHRASH